MIKGIMLTLLSLVLFGSAAIAQDDLSFSGSTYFDYTHDISKDGPKTNGQSNEFMFRRIYFTVDKKIDDTFSLRFRTDAERPDGKKLIPFVKHVYLKWKNLVPSSSLYIGISGTPTWAVAEGVWGYRGLRKTIWDNFNYATGVSVNSSSAATGLALQGTLADEKVVYHSMISNGTGYSKTENDMYKKLYTSVSTKISNFTIEGYIDHQATSSDNSDLTLKGFAGYEKDGLAAGIEFYNMTVGTDSSDGKLNGLSLFGRYDVSENGTVVARFDMYDPSDADNDEVNLIIAGFDYRAGKGISVIPNIFYYTYAADNVDPDIIANITFLWSFK